MSRRRGDERRGREALGRVEVPDERRAEERARQVVVAAFDEREQDSTASRRSMLRSAVILAAAGLIAGFALTPAGADVGEWITDRVDLGEDDAERRLWTLPTSGSLLVENSEGVWILREDGSKRRLGDFDEATWSPNGLFVGVSDGPELRAVDPAGVFRWSVEGGAPIEALDWSTDEGFRVAYVAGGELRVVTGDGATGSTVGPAASVAPAWQPESDPASAIHRLSYVDPENRVVTVATDSGRIYWRTEPYSMPVESIEWSGDGERLLVAAGDFAAIQDARGEALLKGPIATEVDHAAIAPDGSSVAVVSAGSQGTELTLVSKFGRSTRLYSSGKATADARFGPPVFSPDGDWILLPWPEADQWLFVNTEDRRVTAVADVARQFDSDDKGDERFPEVAGWCC